ncbi:MAG TPA: hypothetical protein VI386_11415 [Candidatus Sulfotelmatobacter sp.]
MQSIVGIFRSRMAAEQAVSALGNRGVPRTSIIFLTAQSEGHPGDEVENELREIPTTDAEADGMGKSVGALMGGGVGASAGLAGGAALASVLVPGVGTIFALGLGAAAVLGLGGALAGAKAGDATEHALDTGVPKDDIVFYRELLKRGRSIVIANIENEGLAAEAASTVEELGGENVEEARKEVRAAA